MTRLAIAVLTLCSALGCATLPRQGQSFRELEYPVPTSLLNVDGMEVAYADLGAGDQTVLLIHGLGSYLPAWSRNLSALAAHARVVAIDLPGFGKSSKANYAYSMAFFARVVDRVIDQLKLEHVVLVGHSMGGQIALTHALLFPGKAEALVLTAPAGFERFKPGEGAWLEGVVTKQLILATPPEAVYANVAQFFSGDLPREAEFMVSDRIRIMGGPDFDGFAYANARSVSAMLHGPVFERLGQIHVPVLVIFGENDRGIPNPVLHGGFTRAIAEAGTTKIPGARLVLLPNTGHFVQFERPEVWNSTVLGFLKDLQRSPVRRTPGD